MSERLAILACGGALPVMLAHAHPEALHFTLRGVPSELGETAQEFPLERIGGLFAAMREAGVKRMVFAGSLTRPALNPAEFDAEMTRLAPRLMAAIPQGDDALLRFVISMFEEQGFDVLGAHELLPGLTVEKGLAVGPTPSEAELSDAARAAHILAEISPLDIGQSCVVAGGQCLGIETVQGTDALLAYVAQTPDALRRGQRGVYVKAPKRGQDLRIDMPTVGPSTVDGVADAGLAGLVVAANCVVILDREVTLARAEERGIFLISQAIA
ncbi:LpxI family protein [Roseovarius sp. Pro17]|uniref:LpxI family protein n=1 Tax=Roseovarius sp. Pro17 TaxID=3108175 RepID=UPI002D768A00|nr:UDP-2,3-diacylglucosamine diphosphatase LpxI [Roseovarius sp. Pro17]